MDEIEYTHVTVTADDLEESVEFYETVFGLEKVPTPEFDQKVQWFRVGDFQLHLVETDHAPPAFNHKALHVDDFETVYENVKAHEKAEVEPLPQIEKGWVDGEPPVYYLPTDEVQFYIRDPAGNMIEVNHPNRHDIDSAVVPNIIERTDVTPGGPDEPPAPIYMD